MTIISTVYSRWPEAESDSKYWENEGGVDEVKEADGEDEGSGVPTPGVPVEKQGHHNHQVWATIVRPHFYKLTVWPRLLPNSQYGEYCRHHCSKH